jgi:hypothetical protein
MLAGLLLPVGTARAGDDCGSGGPGASTPGLQVHVTQASSGLKLTAVARVDADGRPDATLVIFDPRGLPDGGVRIDGFEVHRVALLSDHHSDHLAGGDQHGDGLRATVRGAGHLDDGTVVQVWIDVEDNGTRANIDRARVRIRPLTAPHTGEDPEHDDGCRGGGGGSAGWDYPWMTVRQVQVSITG